MTETLVDLIVGRDSQFTCDIIAPHSGQQTTPTQVCLRRIVPPDSKVIDNKAHTGVGDF